MKKFLLLFSGLIIILIACEPKQQKAIIAFGSCSHEFDSAQLWNEVIAHNPIAWIWMGDNIYGDTEDMTVLKSKYTMQKERPSYQNLIKTIPVYGVWDDHDFGVNDGGKEYPKKDMSKELMMDFLDIPANAPVRSRNGAYQSYTIEQDDLKIKLILLDTRYFRDSLFINLNAPPLYLPNPTGTILGDEQWNWLEGELTNSGADIHLIGSSIQVIPNEQGYEKWGNFPEERKRLFSLLENTKPLRPILLSGDRHIAEFSKIQLSGLNYPLYEFTSSGLTHTWGTERPEPNRFRIGKMIIKKNFGVIAISHDHKNITINLRVYGSNNELLSETQAIF